jgi:CDP-2,3-bis-(O-geranylgeranyl)-sn-glycerol synthase
MDLLFAALVIFSPAGIANMMPILASKIPGLTQWNAPMDSGRNFGGKRIFGDHKTWRGFISGVVGGTLFGLIVHQVYDFGATQAEFLLFSAAISAGALLGDAVKSFFKRRVRVAPGKSWFPFDQIDYVIGGLLFMLPFGVLSLSLALTIFGLYFGLHLLISYIGYLLHLKSTPI